MIRVLSDSETSMFLARHPEITASDIPTWGLRLVDGGKDYLVGLQHTTGMIKVMDLTVYDSEGNRIDPSISDDWEITQYARAVISGSVDAAKDILEWTPLILATGAIIAFVWFTRK